MKASNQFRLHFAAAVVRAVAPTLLPAILRLLRHHGGRVRSETHLPFRLGGHRVLSLRLLPSDRHCIPWAAAGRTLWRERVLGQGVNSDRTDLVLGDLRNGVESRDGH